MQTQELSSENKSHVLLFLKDLKIHFTNDKFPIFHLLFSIRRAYKSNRFQLMSAKIMQLVDQHPKHCLEVLKLPHSIHLMFIFYLDELMIEINIIIENNKRSLTVFMKISSSSLPNQRNWTFPKHFLKESILISKWWYLILLFDKTMLD